METNIPENKSFFQKNIKEISAFAISIIVSLLGFLLLPDKIFVSLLSNAPTPETSRNLFLVGMTFIVGLSALMSIFNEDTKKWFAIEVVLLLVQIAIVAYNLIVL